MSNCKTVENNDNNDDKNETSKQGNARTMVIVTVKIGVRFVLPIAVIPQGGIKRVTNNDRSRIAQRLSH
jgi:hypothetical protein